LWNDPTQSLGAIHTDHLKDLKNTRRSERCIMPKKIIFIPCLSNHWMAFKTKVMSVAASWPLDAICSNRIAEPRPSLLNWNYDLWEGTLKSRPVIRIGTDPILVVPLDKLT
jgi:hypothetical protein